MLHVPTGKQQKFARMSAVERLRYLGSKVVSTTAVSDIVEIGDMLWDEAGCFPEGGAAFVVGDTRAGKSTAVAEFADRLFDRLRAENPAANWLRPETSGTAIRGIAELRPENGMRRPLVCVFVDPQPTFKSLMKNTASEMGIELKSGFTFDDAMTAFKHHVKHQEIKMLIFDEVQHIVKGKKTRGTGEDAGKTYEAADVLKVMCKAGLQVLCVGLPEALDLGTVNEQLGELASHNYQLTPMACSLADFNGKPRTPYRKFLAALDNERAPILPFDQTSNFSESEMALRLHRATHGYIGRIMRLLKTASHLAIRRNLSKLGPMILADAYRQQTRCNDDRNWFLMNWPTLLKQRDIPDPGGYDGERDDEDRTASAKGRSRSNPLRSKR